jgi:hypothetical protein
MKIISFSSHTSTWHFALPEAAIASALQKKGHEVLFITPGNLFPGISSLKQEAILRNEFGLKGYNLGTVLTKKDFERIARLLSKLNINNFDEFVIDGIQIGKISLYEFLLHSKKMSAKLSDAQWSECKIYLKNTLISFFACRKIIKAEKPDRILMYSTLYSIDHVWKECAEKMGVTTYFMDHGLNFSDTNNTLIIGKFNTFYYINKLKKIWLKIKSIPTHRRGLDYVVENFLELLKAKHFLVYSAPKNKENINIRKIFNIKDNQKILTATMSSYDEMFAAEYVGVWDIPKKLIFATQAVWIKELINYVKNKQNLFLIIRVHPREFPNKREGVKSDHAKMLEKVLKNLPDNVKINWPTDKISIYDLDQETDVFLNAWSSVGVEMSLLGIPVVIYSKELVLYPHDLNYLAKDRKDYFAKIELALKNGWSYEKIKKTYRWLALYYYHTIVRLRRNKKGVKQSNISKLLLGVAGYFYNLIPLKLRAFLIKIYFAIPGLGIGQKQVDDCRRQLAEHMDISEVEKMLKKSGDTLVDVEKILKRQVTEKEEDYFIRHEVKIMYSALYVGLSKGGEIKKNSLQYNLKQVFIKNG